MTWLWLVIIVVLIYLLIKTQQAVNHNMALAKAYRDALTGHLGTKEGMKAFFESLENYYEHDKIWKVIGQQFGIPIVYDESGYIVSDETKGKIIQILEAYEKPAQRQK